MIRLPIALALLAITSPGIAQTKPADQADASQPLQRIRNVQLKSGEKCPPAASPDEIVVCGTLDEPYRIPKPLRETKKTAKSQSWVNRTETIDEVGRVAGGLPDTCSVVGTGGQTGCVSKMLRDYAADKRQQKADAAAIP